MNPIVMLEQVGKLANASKAVAALQKIDNLNAAGEAKPDGTPDYINMMNDCKQFVEKLAELNHLGAAIMKQETELADELKTMLEKQKS